MDLMRRVIDAFAAEYGGRPALVARAPGRVNLIGEHTDYNVGFCLPMAIDRATWIALRPRDGEVGVQALDMDDALTFALDAIPREVAHWGRYVTGVAWALQENGYAPAGWEGVLSGDVPIGSGLSSSAALELAVAQTFAAVSGFAWEPTRMAQIAQQTENHWLGLKSGIMDQLISANGLAGHALLMDCRALTLTPVPLPAGTAVVVMDTRTPRDLVSSAYNQRRAECEQAAAVLGVPALRDAGPADLARVSDQLPPVIFRRARHVISENERTLAAAEAMRAGYAVELGRLMNASHDSLRDDYEVTSDTLNAMVDSARRQPGCLGARMTGAGFGGCAIALVRAAEVVPFMAAVTSEYERRTGLTPDLFVAQPSAGASLVEPAA
jgi:galactokinase